MPTILIDGLRFASLDEFWDEVGRELRLGMAWGRNLDAFDDMLGSASGPRDGGFTVRWLASEVSRGRLGVDATLQRLTERVAASPAAARGRRRQILDDFNQGKGLTLFEQLVAIIRDHGRRGPQGGGGIELILA